MHYRHPARCPQRPVALLGVLALSASLLPLSLFRFRVSLPLPLYLLSSLFVRAQVNLPMAFGHAALVCSLPQTFPALSAIGFHELTALCGVAAQEEVRRARCARAQALEVRTPRIADGEVDERAHLPAEKHGEVGRRGHGARR